MVAGTGGMVGTNEARQTFTRCQTKWYARRARVCVRGVRLWCTYAYVGLCTGTRTFTVLLFFCRASFASESAGVDLLYMLL